MYTFLRQSFTKSLSLQRQQLNLNKSVTSICHRIMSSYTYPQTRRDESVIDNFHGVEIKDPYRFLEDPDSEETRQFVTEQNIITNSFLEECEYRPKIQERITNLWNYPKYGIPFKRGSFYYYFKNSGLQNQSILYQQSSLDEEAKEFLDPNKFAEDGTSALQQLEFSEDGKLLAYIVCEKGSDWGTIKFMSVETREVLEKDTLNNVKFSCLCWTHDNKGIFYNRFPTLKSDGTSIEKNEFQQLCFHKVGSDQSQDVVVAHFPDEPNWMGHAEISHCGNYLFMSISQSCDPTNKFWYYDLKAANYEVTEHLTFNKIIDNFDSKWKYVTNEGPFVTFKTNESKALKYKLVKIDLENNKMHTLVPESEDVLQHVGVFDQNKIIINYMHDCKDELYLYDLTSGEKIKKFNNEIGTISTNSRKKDSFFFYKHASFTSPGDIYRFEVVPNKDVTSTESVLFRRSEFAGIDLNGFDTEQVFYQSKDGAKIPMFLISKKGLQKNENTPTILYGYGGFNISLTPTFSVTRLVWLQHFDGVYAIANIRGGGEYGEEWYNAGRLFNKQNCFDDFCGAADHLIENKMTSKEKLIINGGSNGGLLVTACINQRPDLFYGAIADVAYDNYNLVNGFTFTIGSYWVSDYGCAEKKEDFDYMIKYSPLHTIKKGAKYPHVLLATADHDDRVVPSHSYKYIKELQHQNGDQDNAFLIRIETKAGHGAGKPTSKVIQEYSDKFGYLAKILSLKWQD